MYDPTARHARRLAQFARRNSLTARVVPDVRHGWICQVRTPWHETPQTVRDSMDVAMIVAEIDHEQTATKTNGSRAEHPEAVLTTNEGANPSWKLP
jgi:hypothetical protein